MGQRYLGDLLTGADTINSSSHSDLARSHTRSLLILRSVIFSDPISLSSQISRASSIFALSPISDLSLADLSPPTLSTRTLLLRLPFAVSLAPPPIFQSPPPSRLLRRRRLLPLSVAHRLRLRRHLSTAVTSSFSRSPPPFASRFHSSTSVFERRRQ